MRSVLLFVFALLAGATAHASPRLAPEDIFRLNWAGDPRVSPDGSFIVYTHNFMDVMEDRRRSNLWRIDSDGRNARPITTGAVNDGNARIGPEGRRVAYTSATEAGAQLFVRWLDGGETLQLTRLPRPVSNLAWSPDGNWLAFNMLVSAEAPTMGALPKAPEGAKWADPPSVVDRAVFRFDGRGELPVGYSQVFVVPAGGGAPRQVTGGNYHHDGAIAWTGDSRGLFVTGIRRENAELDPRNTDIYRVDLDGGELTAVTDRRGPDDGVRVSPDGRRLLWYGYDDRRLSYQRTRLYVADLDGANRRELLPELDRSVENPRWASDGRGIYFQYDDRGRTRLAHVSLRGKLTDIADTLGGLGLSRPYSGAAFSVGGGNTFAFTSGDSLKPADIAAGRGTGKPVVLTDLSRNLLDNRALAPVEEMLVKSGHDGREIQFWVARPADFDPAGRYPLILEIHGGPHTAYGPHFSAEVQLYAAAGYVVVYANPRGSTSYGEEFAQTIHHNYPSEDYDDLISVVDAVVAQGSIDPDRLYVTGGSGGGVLTAWIVGRTDRFRAAVVAKPVINWISFVLSADWAPYFAQYWFPAMPWEDPMGHWRRSPLSLVGNVSTPTMLLTGQEDWRTPMWESEQFYQALKLRGVDTALVRIPGASHSIASRPSQLMAKVAAILEWFDRHGGDGENDDAA